jgi:hypothetical protein
MHSPQIIHAEVQDFMTLVQRLTGSSSSSDTHSCSAKSENLTADQCTVIRQTSDATTSSQVAEYVYLNMGSSRIGNGTSDVNPTTSSSITKIDRNQEIESRASEAEATDLAQSAVTFSGDFRTAPF